MELKSKNDLTSWNLILCSQIQWSSLSLLYNLLATKLEVIKNVDIDILLSLNLKRDTEVFNLMIVIQEQSHCVVLGL